MTRLSKDQDAHWEQVGREAFHAGKVGAPGIDPVVRDAIAGLPVGDIAAPLMRAWFRGWNAENIAAPVV